METVLRDTKGESFIAKRVRHVYLLPLYLTGE